MQAQLPVSESARLGALRTFQILDTPAEVAFDRIAHLASEILDMPMAAVSFVDRDRQWFKARVGLPVCETSRDIAFCAHAILEDDLLVVPDATKDWRFADNEQVTGEPHLRFYAGALLYAADRQPLGTLCVLDTRPREINSRQRKILRDLAAITMDELSLRSQHQTLQKQNRAIEERTLALTAVNRTLHYEILQRERTEEALRQAKQAAEEANRAKSGFLSRMSHELRTPLNSILGFGQLLELNPLGTQDAFSVQEILKGGRHLLALVDEVLDISRAETGDLRLVFSNIEIDQFLQGCVSLVTRLAEMHGVTCTVEKSRWAASIRVDEQHLRQIVLNLLSNAIKYNHRGGKIILSSAKTSSNRLRINVSDTGPGISPEGLSRLFVPFERLKHENGEIEGTGLGLVVSRRIAEAMDGSVDVSSESGHGSTFWIELPLEAAGPTFPLA